MRTTNNILFSIIVFSFAVINTGMRAQGIMGNIINTNGEPVPFVSVYVPALHKGTTANEEGDFHLSLIPGEYELLFQYLGYKTQSFNVIIADQYLTIDIVLEPQHYILPEVIITSSGEDPAYFIMRKAIGMSQYYRNQVSEYSVNVYLKGTGVPEKIPALLRKQLKKDGIETGKYFVTETISEIHYKKGEPIQTNVISMRSSGIAGETSPMQFVTLSLYDDIDGIISPLSRNAFQVYRYKLEGTFIEDGQTINKIEVIPRRKGHDLYRGTVFIREGSWNLHSVNLLVEQKMLKVNIRQVYRPIDQIVWMPVSHDYDVYFSALGAAFSFRYLVSLNDYKISLNPEIDHAFYARMIEEETFISELTVAVMHDTTFSSESSNEKQQRVEALLESNTLSNKEMRELNRLIRMEASKSRERPPLEVKLQNTEIADSAQLRKPEYWQQNRPVPLTISEKQSFDEPIADSLLNDTTAQKNGLASEILFGKSDRKLSEKWSLNHNGLIGLSSFDYNTVNGFSISKKLGINHQADQGRRLKFHFELAYAFARERLQYEGGIDYLYHPFKRAGFSIKGGRINADFNWESGIMPFFNVFTTLFTKQNFLKLYEKDFISFNHQIDIFNGFEFQLTTEYAHRKELDNHANFFITNFLGKDFTPNVPPPVVDQPQLLASHKAMIFDATISYTPRHYYRIVNHRKQMLNSAYPTIAFRWRQGLHELFSSNTQFQQMEFSLKHGFEKRLIGRFDYLFKLGFFPERAHLYYTDYKHFNNNPLWISGGSKLEMFRGLNFYDNSTDKPYFEGHIQYQHGRILLKRIPFLANSLLRESLFVNGLGIEGSKPYLEFGYGINQIFLVFDLELFTGWSGGKHHFTGIRLGIPIGEGVVRF